MSGDLPESNRRLAPGLCLGPSDSRLGLRPGVGFSEAFGGGPPARPLRTADAEFCVELRIVCLQSGCDERCIFRRVPAEAPANHPRRLTLAVEDEPFAVFAPHLEESSLLHAAREGPTRTVVPLSMRPRISPAGDAWEASIPASWNDDENVQSRCRQIDHHCGPLRANAAGEQDA